MPILKAASRHADETDVTSVGRTWAEYGADGRVLSTAPSEGTHSRSPDAVMTAEFINVHAGQRVVRFVTERLLHADADELDGAIDGALRALGEFLAIDRVHVFSMEGSTIRTTHEWCAPGIRAEIDDLQDVPAGAIDPWMTVLERGHPCIIPDIPALSLQGPEEEGLIAPRALSVLAVPMMIREEVVGFIGFDAVRSHRRYTEFEVGLLQSLVDVLTSAVVRQRSDTKAERAERRLAALTRYAIDFILILGEDARIRFASGSWSTIGFDPTALVGTSWLDHVHTEDVAPLLDLARSVIRRSGPEQVTVLPDFRVHTADGTWRWFAGSMSDVRHDGVVDGIVVNLHDVTERRGVQDQLAHDARHDPLTGLGNRAMLAEKLGYVCRRAQRDRSSLALVFLDLDRFKLVNDSHGHAVGDEVLIEVGRRLATVVRASDVVARFGGDEFVVLLDGFADRDEIERLVLRLEQAFDPHVIVGGQPYRVTASMGVVLADGDALDPVALLRDADAAMYRAKEAGRDRVVVFDESIRTGVLRRLALVQRLPQALAEGCIDLAFQPVVDLRSCQVVGAEALARWQDDELGPVPPIEFVPVIEEIGCSTRLTELVIARTLGALAGWPDRITVAVNLSLTQLLDSNLLEIVGAGLRRYRVPPERLCIELTESSLMVDSPRVASVLRELRALGVRTALDDFGTGYSSLALLRELPIDLLKIDREFVKGVHLDDRDRRLVDAVISLANDFGMETVAEGVELVEQQTILVEAGCRYAQGDLFGRAVPAEVITACPSR